MKLKVTNPATGEVAATLDADDAKSVKAKYMQARAAQPGWARTPLRKRLEAIAKFRDLVRALCERKGFTLPKPPPADADSGAPADGAV